MFWLLKWFEEIDEKSFRPTVPCQNVATEYFQLLQSLFWCQDKLSEKVLNKVVARRLNEDLKRSAKGIEDEWREPMVHTDLEYREGRGYGIVYPKNVSGGIWHLKIVFYFIFIDKFFWKKS